MVGEEEGCAAKGEAKMDLESVSLQCLEIIQMLPPA